MDDERFKEDMRFEVLVPILGGGYEQNTIRMEYSDAVNLLAERANAEAATLQKEFSANNVGLTADRREVVRSAAWHLTQALDALEALEPGKPKEAGHEPRPDPTQP